MNLDLTKLAISYPIISNMRKFKVHIVKSVGQHTVMYSHAKSYATIDKGGDGY